MKRVAYIHDVNVCGSDCPYYEQNLANSKITCNYFDPPKFISGNRYLVGQEFPDFCELKDDIINNGVM